MIRKKLDPMFILSALSFWILIGFLNPYVHLISISWLNGCILAWIVFIPLLFLIMKMDPRSLPVICVSTTILGTAVGFFSGYFIG
jgi:uncharacterized membrane protein